MATITGLTAEAMEAIRTGSIVGARIVGDNLIVTTRGGTDITAGNVRGPQGIQGLTPTLRSTSTTSQAIALGSKTWTIASMPVPFPVGSTVKIQGTISTNYMVGLVTASTATSITVNVLEMNGTGTLASWTITIGSFQGAQGPQGIPGPAGPNLRGTSAQRDATYGTPTTVAQHVALANQKPVWFNTDLGFFEGYYATTGSAGLTARGLESSVAHGWFPVGPGPRCLAWGSPAQGMTPGTIANFWSLTVTEAYVSHAGYFELYDSNRRLRVLKAGRYTFTGKMKFPSGSGQVNCAWRGNIPQGSLSYAETLGSYFNTRDHVVPEMLFLVNNEVYFENIAGTWNAGAGSAMFLEYLGPPLVSA